LRGWIKAVVARSPIWGDLDIAVFCRETGYSREHATRTLSAIRREGEFAFETKIRSRRRRCARNWGVIVADPRKLRFDRASLFYDARGRALHNRSTLARGGEKLTPTCAARPHIGSTAAAVVAVDHSGETDAGARHAGRGDAEQPVEVEMQDKRQETATPVKSHYGRRCDAAYIKDSYGIQQIKEYGAGRGITLSRRDAGADRMTHGRLRLRRRAFAALPLLLGSHWDNCKVTYCRRAAFSLVFGALREGHSIERIVSSYERALHVAHGFAVDRAARTGRVVFFNPSSTILGARRILAADGLTREERIREWRAKESELQRQISDAFREMAARM
jgi:hypothetical protein